MSLVIGGSSRRVSRPEFEIELDRGAHVSGTRRGNKTGRNEEEAKELAVGYTSVVSDIYQSQTRAEYLLTQRKEVYWCSWNC